jgi:hypothetical protein
LREVLKEEVSTNFIPKAIEISIRSGIPCSYTSFGPILKPLDEGDFDFWFWLKIDHEMNVRLNVEVDDKIADIKSIIQSYTEWKPEQQSLICDGMKIEEVSQIPKGAVVDLRISNLKKGFERSEIEFLKKKFDVDVLLLNHSIEGYWMDLGELMRVSGLEVRVSVPDEINEVMKPTVEATIIALGLLRRRCADQEMLWSLLMMKALEWLENVRSGVSWLQIIDEAIPIMDSLKPVVYP